jgi:enoyl-CoA hydratase/carnithine racemase
MALIRTKRKDDILIAEFGDPSTRNSFSLQAAEELLRIGSSPEARALVFSAPGRVFCSGGNLSDYAGMTTADEGLQVNRRIAEILDLVSKLAIPTVCAIHGDCFGGGIELVSAFDRVLAAPHILFGFWQRKISLSFGWGGGARIQSRIGAQRTKALALSAAMLGAAEAFRIGLIDRVCLESELLGEAIAEAHALQSLPPGPVAGLKGAVPEREAFEKLWWSEEHRAVLKPRARKNR